MNKTTSLRLFFVLILGVWASVIIMIGLTALPYHSTSLPADVKFKAQVLFPEGWHFFTRDAREMQTWVYTKDDSGEWMAEPRMPNSNSYNFFGANREGRAMGVEYAMFLKDVKPANWVDYRGEVSDLLASSDTIPVTQFDSEFNHPVMCGEYLMVAQKPVPWAWSPSYERVKMPAKVTRIIINCQP